LCLMSSPELLPESVRTEVMILAALMIRDGQHGHVSFSTSDGEGYVESLNERSVLGGTTGRVFTVHTSVNGFRGVMVVRFMICGSAIEVLKQIPFGQWSIQLPSGEWEVSMEGAVERRAKLLERIAGEGIAFSEAAVGEA